MTPPGHSIFHEIFTRPCCTKTLFKGPPCVVKIQNLLSNPDDINYDNKFAVIHPDQTS